MSPTCWSFSSGSLCLTCGRGSPHAEHDGKVAEGQMSCSGLEQIANVAFHPVRHLWAAAVCVVLVGLELVVGPAVTTSLAIRLEGEEFLLEPKILITF